MNEDFEKLEALISGSDTNIDREWLEEMKRRYPFFKIPEGIAAGNGKIALTDEQKDELIAGMALCVPEGEAAGRLAGDDGASRFDNFYPETPAPKTPSTTQTIDNFLAAYGDIDPAETETLEKLIFNPVADYSQQLARQERDSMPADIPEGDSQDARINRFIISVKEKEGATLEIERPETPDSGPCASGRNNSRGKNSAASASRQKTLSARNDESRRQAETDNTLLSESLAKIFIKTHRYERAFEIISRLSLSFPEKNAYFADQLRFLRKLMFAEEMRKRKNENSKNIE